MSADNGLNEEGDDLRPTARSALSPLTRPSRQLQFSPVAIFFPGIPIGLFTAAPEFQTLGLPGKRDIARLSIFNIRFKSVPVSVPPALPRHPAGEPRRPILSIEVALSAHLLPLSRGKVSSIDSLERPRASATGDTVRP